VITDEDLAGNAARVGAHITAGALTLGARKVWGHGLLLGLDFGRPAKALQEALFSRRLLTGTATDPGILRLMPPLTLTVQEADVLLAGLREVVA
jgi:acetylornithine aminotransferase